MLKNIALVAGGYSGEYVISVQSAAVIERHLDKSRYACYKIIITREAWTYTDPGGKTFGIDKNDFSLPLPTGRIRFDTIFIGIHGTPGEDGKLQGYFDMLQLPYTSCGAITSALTFNKSFCNKTVASLGVVNVSPSVHLFKDQAYQCEDILSRTGLPCFVKPNEGGSSIGTSRVNRAEELQPAIDKAMKEDSQVLVEAYVKGRELTCGLFKTRGRLTVLPITEVIASREFFDYEAKYTPGRSREITPAEINGETAVKIKTTAEQLYKALNCRGIVRMDFILEDGTDKLFFLEANTMPGQSENSIVPQQVRAAGMSLGDFYGQLVEESLRNGQDAKNEVTGINP